MRSTRSKTHQFIALAGLILLLARGSTVLPTRVALAETGSLTITQVHNDDATYDAYHVFAADIGPDDLATHVAWTSGNMEEAVVGYLDSQDYQTWLEDHHPSPEAHDVAQNAAEYISEMIAGSEEAPGTTTTPRTTEGRSFANGLARALHARKDIKPEAARAAETFEGDQGYWLFVSSPQSLDAPDDAGTAPLWVALGGSVDAITEKSALPSLDKEVREDSTDTWGKTADAQRGQVIDYRLTGTLPSNFSAFENYHYRFTDTFSEGLELALGAHESVADAIQVQVGDKEVPIDDDQVRATYEHGVLTVDFADLRNDAWEDYGITTDTTIVVSYQASLNAKATIGAAGNLNEAVLTYANDPTSLHEGHTTPVQTKVFTYALTLLKQDREDSHPLEGAVFSIEAKEPEDAGARFVQEDGSLGGQAHAFATASDGSLEVSGLDEGSYLIRETKAPEGHELLATAIGLTIRSDLRDEDLTLTKVEAKAESDAATVKNVDGESALIELAVTNERTPPPTPPQPTGDLPQTGVAPFAEVAVIAGTCLLAASRLRTPPHKGGPRPHGKREKNQLTLRKEDHHA